MASKGESAKTHVGMGPVTDTDDARLSGVHSSLRPEPQGIATSPTLRPARQGHAEELESGLVLQDAYEIRGVLGHGGMGSVYSAQDLNLKRPVAIKVPSNDLAADSMRQEAEALAAFSHRGLPVVYAMGSHHGWPFIAMERISGRTLQQAIDEHAEAGGVPIGDAIHWMLQLVDVVRVLHEANLAHRDLKPDNVILGPRDRLVLLDLGIVRQERFIDTETSISGSPHYMAPETVRGDMVVGQAHLVDIYALGVTAYQLLTGHWPFDGEGALEIMHKQMLSPVPRVSAEREVPPLLDDIVAEMMAKEPEDRPHSIELVEEIFVKLQEGRTSLRRRPTRLTPGMQV